MAKVTGPLLSVSASGTVAGLMTHRATRHGAIVQAPAIPDADPSPAQLAERARFKAALIAWKALDLATMGAWQAAGYAGQKQPVLLFTREYLLQRCSGDALPLIPAPAHP